jgi:hypothetical protein
MATDAGSGEATRGIFATGQGTDAVSSPEHAMTAPGSAPAAHDILPDRSAPGPPSAEPRRYTGRHLHTAAPGGGAPGRWDDVSGRREPWGR